MFTLNCKGRLLTINQPIVMGILNINEESFYSGNRYTANDELLLRAQQMIADGAAILDMGGQSTRPGSEMISADEELTRVIPAIESVHKIFPETIISVDTFYAKVAKEAVQAGASIINDISAGSLDEALIDVVASLNVPYVLMHMQGTPQTMQQLNEYDDVTKSVIDYFISKTEECKKAGINDVIIDPGFGFSKNISQNFQLHNNLDKLKMLDRPMLVGLSRKSTVYKTLGVTAEEALNGTTVLNTVALMKGASILRVHDVKEAKECVTLYSHLAGF